MGMKAVINIKVTGKEFFFLFYLTSEFKFLISVIGIIQIILAISYYKWSKIFNKIKSNVKFG